MDQIKREQRSVAREPERGRRRRYTTAQKVAIVRQCLVPRASLAGVAMAHQANANMVRKLVVKFHGGGYGDARESGMPLLAAAGGDAGVPPKQAPAAATVPLEL